MTTSFTSNGLSRRALLRLMTAMAGGAAALPLIGSRRAYAETPDLPPDFGRGRSIAIVGAGVAGLTAGWKLANAGFKVTIYEATDRYGGRSLTPRPVRPEYRDWWFNKYNPERLFPKMYVSEYQEDSRSPASVKQVCRFDDPTWDSKKGGSPVELFLNAGPGRIPSDHVKLIELCQDCGVALEPYIFQSNYNLLQSASFRNGEPIAYNQVNYSVRGQVAEMLAKVVETDPHITPDQRKAMINLLQQFGDLNEKFGNTFVGSTRTGYSKLPGGWREAPVAYPPVPLDETLHSKFVGGGNPETSPGSFLYNADNIDWQNSLMQPIGGMDRVWQRLLVKKIQETAVSMTENDPRAADLKARDAGPNGVQRYVGDLVLLNHPVTAIIDRPDDPKIYIAYNIMTPDGRKIGQGRDAVDFCFSGMAPTILSKIDTTLSKEFKAALNEVKQTPAIKVGWQAKSRFWERDNKIYGGISWTDDIIGQIWYPSEDFNASTGVLTGAYNRGENATEFGSYDQAKRLAKALEGGEKLHKHFKDKVYADKGLTIAWHYMPYQVGGWASDTATDQPTVYEAITDLPQGRLYLAGDAWSYLPGWQEGAITSVYAAINALQQKLK
jgi:monoamine oxidase